MLVTDIEFRDEYNKMIEIKKSENKSDDADVFDCQNV